MNIIHHHHQASMLVHVTAIFQNTYSDNLKVNYKIVLHILPFKRCKYLNLLTNT